MNNVAIEFSVRSASSDETYRLTATATGKGARFSCSCPAGQNETACKHRAALLVGDLTGLVEIDEAAVGRLHALAAASPIMAALERVHQAEGILANAQRELKSAKKALSRAMMG